jgi:hypothetical protein
MDGKFSSADGILPLQLSNQSMMLESDNRFVNFNVSCHVMFCKTTIGCPERRGGGRKFAFNAI